MRVTRRQLLGGAATFGLFGAIAGPGAGAAQAAGPQYPFLVPELYRPIPDAPDHSEALVIGTGFGASITAARLASSGVSVTMLERGSKWPTSSWRPIFANDALPDGRAYWRSRGVPPLTGAPTVPTDSYGGVLEVTTHGTLSVWRGSLVGGGSMVFTGVMIQPEQRHFEDLFGSTVPFEEMNSTYYPRVRNRLNLSTLPTKLYESRPFTHSRIWDADARKAGYSPKKIEGLWNWDTVAKELRGASRPSAIKGESNLGNANGAKFDLNQNYLLDAQATGRCKIYARHEVTSVSRAADGRYVVTIDKLDPAARVLKSRTLTCDRLFLGAGSMGTSELLVKAKATGALPNLNEHVGKGWGNNGDAALVRGLTTAGNGLVQAAPSASMISDSQSLPVTLENWYVPGLPLDMSLIGSLGMVMDPTRGEFVFNSKTSKTELIWPDNGNANVVAALRAVHNRIAAAAGTGVGFPLAGVPDVNASFTAHPLGGVVIGKATDDYGRVRGYDGLYVVDGALIPGSTGAVNPSLTISALAERNIEQIIAAKG
ncbi:GMC oxidoreductase [Microbacterium sp. NPDC076768]|uniref:GMC oxidoreductase n=1 Tax=Microbacterium sp. NPDC076768 TaxID=3154858 RepID=UPI0034142B96